MAAILEDAVQTLTTDPRRCTNQRRRDFADALEWIPGRRRTDGCFLSPVSASPWASTRFMCGSGLLRKISEIHDSKATIRPKGCPSYRSPRRKVIRLRAE